MWFLVFFCKDEYAAIINSNCWSIRSQRYDNLVFYVETQITLCFLQTQLTSLWNKPLTSWDTKTEKVVSCFLAWHLKHIFTFMCFASGRNISLQHKIWFAWKMHHFTPSKRCPLSISMWCNIQRVWFGTSSNSKNQLLGMAAVITHWLSLI